MFVTCKRIINLVLNRFLHESTTVGEINTSNMETAHPPVGGWELLSSAKSPAPSVDMIAAGDALE